MLNAPIAEGAAGPPNMPVLLGMGAVDWNQK